MKISLINQSTPALKAKISFGAKLSGEVKEGLFETGKNILVKSGKNSEDYSFFKYNVSDLKKNFPDANIVLSKATIREKEYYNLTAILPDFDYKDLTPYFSSKEELFNLPTLKKAVAKLKYIETQYNIEQNPKYIDNTVGNLLK